MIRIIGIALLIWGLVAQPLMAAIVESTPFIEPSSSMSADNSQFDVSTSHHGSMDGDEAAPAPCHEMAEEDTSSMPCTDCDSGCDCDNGACVSARAQSSAAVIDHSVLKLERLAAVRAVGKNLALIQGLPSRIFHPPKHA